MHFPGSIIQPCNQFELLESCALIIEQSYGVVIEKGLEEAQTKAQVTSWVDEACPAGGGVSRSTTGPEF